MVLYQTTIFADTTNVIGLDGQVNAAALIDFETTTKKDIALSIEALYPQETVVLLTWNIFISKVVLWSDVMYVQYSNRYEIFCYS